MRRSVASELIEIVASNKSEVTPRYFEVLISGWSCKQCLNIVGEERGNQGQI